MVKAVAPRAPIDVTNLVDLLRIRADRSQAEPSFVFLTDGQTDEISLTYSQLDLRARQIAARLQAENAAGQRAVLLYAPGLDYLAAFFGCLYAGVVAVPAHLPRLNRPPVRLQAILNDCGPAFALSTRKTATDLARRFPRAEELTRLRWLATDEPDGAPGADWRASPVSSSDLAFLQYTSGSTQTPRGVMVSHGNLIHNCEMIYRLFGHRPESRGVIWLPPFHDMGLIGGLLQPLYGGFPVTLMSPGAFIQRPRRWLEAITRFRGTTSAAPNFAYELCVDRIPPEQRAGLDLSSWRVACNGSEPVRASTMDRFTEAFAPYGFRRETFFPCYGLAEATLLASGGHFRNRGSVRWFSGQALGDGRVEEVGAHESDAKALVSCGAAVPDAEVVIADPETRQCMSSGGVGEIWLRGPDVAQGYWNQPEETAAAFHAVLADGGGPFLRTGDLGFLSDGEVFIAGRIRDLIIIRGANIYPQDVEQTAGACHAALRTDGAAAFAFEAEGEERIAVVLEVEPLGQADASEVVAAIRAAIVDAHEVQVNAVVLVKTGRIPRTTSGKVQRAACRTEFLAGALSGVVASWRAASKEQEALGGGGLSGRRPAVESNRNGDAHDEQGAVSTLLAPPPHRNGDGPPASWPLRDRVQPREELGLDFFSLFLDRQYLSEGAGDWEKAQTLEEAQQAKCRRLAEQALLQPGCRMLDVGSGWGGMLRYGRENRAAAHVVGLTINPAEFEYLAASEERQDVYLCSWADFETEEKYDAIFCLDALAHFASLQDLARGKRHNVYRRFFHKCHDLGAPASRLCLQTLVVVKPADTPQSREDFAFLTRMSPDSSLPATADVLSAAHGLFETVETNSGGPDMAQTLRAWLDRLTAHARAVRERHGDEAYQDYREYFEASLRCLEGGYLDVMQCTWERLGADVPPDGNGIARHVADALVSDIVATPHSTAEIRDWLRSRLAETMRLSADDLDDRQPFATYGLDSLQMVSLIGDLELWLGRALAPTLAWDYPTIEALSRRLSGEEALADEFASTNAPALAEPLAIVGVGCRFPGAHGPDAFWRLIREGGEAIREAPADRWDMNELYDPDPDAPGKITTRWGGFLDQVDCFDPRFFSITPREAARMDPQQRLLLETAWETLENAGLPAERMASTRTGVFVGIGGTDYAHVTRQADGSREHIDAYAGTGNALSIAANRISYVFDLKGPSLAIDTACSSSLTALHYAAQSLANRECDYALAGGVNLILSPEVSIAFSRARMLAPDGRCKPFDADANGYVRGEGCGFVLLKRLADAQRDGDDILAIVRGTAINQDGKTAGITAPNGPAQQECIRQALHRAGVTPDQIDYIEAHGTGTPLGDPIEVQALQAVQAGRPTDAPHVYMGSVKANIGHLETASGVASLIKVVLMLRHGEIPPQRNLTSINPKIPAEGAPLHIARELLPWPARPDRRRFAGISGFGFGGANAHVVLEEGPARRYGRNEVDRPAHLMTLSAQTEPALRELAQRHADLLQSNPTPAFADVCFSANTGRAQLTWRLGLPADSTEALRDKLRTFAENGQASGATFGAAKAGYRPKIAFLFTGQGAQYADMGRGLYETHPTFRRVIDECDEILRDLLDVPLLSVLYPEPGQSSPIDQTQYTQPALFALDYSLARLWESWGVRPDAVLGHSVGEYAAACFAGVFSLQDGLRLIAERGRLMQALPHGGAMAAVLASEERVAALVERAPNQLAVAALNGPGNVVLSGAEDALNAALQELEAEGVAVRRLTVSHAFHSPLLDPMLDSLERAAKRIEFKSPKIALVSNVTGDFFADGKGPDAGYWRRHSRDAVRFEAGMHALGAQGCDVFIEVGPSPTLTSLARKCLPPGKALWLPSLRKGQDDWSALLDGLASLYVHGAKVDWRAFDRPYIRRRVGLPTYPFARERYWTESSKDEKSTGAVVVGRSSHPLLGVRLPSALSSAQFSAQWKLRKLPYLEDHKVQGAVVAPGAAYLETALAAAREVFGDGSHVVEDVTFSQPMFLAEGHTHSVQLVLEGETGSRSAFQFFQAPTGLDGRWTMHASGVVRRSFDDAPPQAWCASLGEVRNACAEELDRATGYRKLSERGLDYGPAFQIIDHLWKQRSEAVARVRLPEAVAKGMGAYQIHPALLDGCLQTVAATIPEDFIQAGSGDTYLPAGVKRLRVYARPEGELWMHARLTTDYEKEGRDLLEGDLQLRDDAGRIFLEMEGLALRRLAKSSGADNEDSLPDWLYEVRWQESAASTLTPPDAAAPADWLLFADASGVGDALASLLRSRGHHVAVAVPGSGTRRLSEDRYQINPEDPAAFVQLLADAASTNVSRFVHLWSLDTAALDGAAGAPLEDARRLGCDAVLHLAQALARANRMPGAPALQLCVATRGAQAVDDAQETVHPAQAPVWGLGRVLSVEHPELNCLLADLDPHGTAAAQASELAAVLCSGAGEDQIAFRNGRRFTPRLVRIPPQRLAPAAQGVGRLDVPVGQPYRLELAGKGSLDCLKLRPARRRGPEAGEVELEVRAAGLNFSDVLKAMGIYPGLKPGPVPLGIECAGVVTAVGEGVTDLTVGDEAVAVAPFSFASHTTTSAVAVVRKPGNISFEEAATIPITFLTAHYALNVLAHIADGERVLIHAGAGGVGLAALQICRSVGAEVFATAGSPEKREFLQSLGAAHVFDSRSLDFADQIREVTHGDGVDVVLNSLPGEAIPKSLGLLRAYGRFLEIGKTDIYQNRLIGLAPFQNNLSYFAIDLDRMLRERPNRVRPMFLEIMEGFRTGRYQPLPLTAFDAAETVSAFRYMAQRKNIGKVVVSMQGERDANSGESGPIRSDGAYLITGGLGALGLQVAGWLLDQGARHLLLLGRSAPSAETQAALDAWRSQGFMIETAQADVTRLEDVQQVLARRGPDAVPLRGVLHASGVLDDGAILQLDRERFARALAPKVQGAWNLHQATLDVPLDFFVLFSSVSCLLGSPGQSNYAAGNAFLDALAHHRRRLGLAALSINWGLWAGAGMAARTPAAQMAARGVVALPPDEALRILGRLLASDTRQAAVQSVDWSRLMPFYQGRAPSLLRDLGAASDAPRAGSGAPMRGRLLATPAAERPALLEQYLGGQLARVMQTDVERIDLRAPLNTLGLDSLMVIELKNLLESDTGVVLPVARFLQGPSIVELAGLVALALDGEPTATASALVEPMENATEFPLSSGQRALWFVYRLAPDNTAYNVVEAVRIRGTLGVEAMRRAIRDLVERHPSLRTTFHEKDGEPFQKIQAISDIPFAVIDASTDDEASLHTRLQDEGRKPFSLETGPNARSVLFRRADDDHILMFLMHHAVTDGWSLVLCTNEFALLYEAERNGRPAALPPPAADYAGFVRWQTDLLASADGERHFAYWQKQLAGELPVLEVLTDRPRPRTQTFHGDWRYHAIRPELTSSLKALAESENATPFMAFLAAYQVLLHRMSGQDDILVGCPTTGRSRAEFAGVVGDFVNPVVVRGDLSGDPTFRDALRRIRDRVLEAFDHQDYPFTQLVERLQPRRDSSRSPIFQTLFVQQKAQAGDDRNLTGFLLGDAAARTQISDLHFETIPLEQFDAQVDLTLRMAEVDGRFSLALQYNTDLFDAATAERLLWHFDTLLTGIVATADQPISRLPLSPDAERRRMLVEWNDTHADFPADSGVHDLIAAQAFRTPNRVAVESERGALTYAELDRLAAKMAYHLKTRGAAPGQRVGVCLERSPEMVAALLGVLRTGAAYVPLDPDFPRERLAAMVADSTPVILLTQASLMDRLPSHSSRFARLEDILTPLSAESDDPHPSTAGSEDPAYVLYTSGSTGRPKGVVVPHRAVVNLLTSMAREPGLAADDVLLAVTTLSFDIAALELFLPLTVGARVVLASREAAADGSRLADWMERSSTTVMQATPATWRMLIDAGWKGNRGLTVLCGGEALPPALADALLERCGSLWNVYGPTETTIWSTCECIDAVRDGRVTIGRPIANTTVYILDARDQPAPSGVAGELTIGGVGVSLGYLNRPELTAERFVPDPFARRPRARMYRTGDRARFLADGRIEFLGRLDHQVKVRGFRIELGEIEAMLERHAAVAQAAAMVHVGSDGEGRLAAYIVSRETAPPVAELREHLRTRLPEYMIPTAFTFLTAMPLTPNGKVDRKALPAPQWSGRPAELAAAPRTGTEKKIAAVWAEILGVPGVGLHDDFFELGGHSLKAVQVLSRLRQLFDKDIPLRALLQNPTVAGAAAVIDADANQGKEQPTTLDWDREAVLDPMVDPAKAVASALTPPREILLTGATGFLGAFLLHELLSQTDARIHCLVRASNEAEGLQRLRTNFDRYGLHAEDITDRVKPILGDLSEPLLGLAPQQFDRLADQIDAVYHNGAVVNYVQPYASLKKPNVLGTQEVLRLAAARKVKPFHYISTVSVLPHATENESDLLLETPEPPTDAPPVDAYSQSKWVAERLVVEARRRGLPVALYRPGRITGHSVTGACNTDDLVYRMLTGCVRLGAVPDLNTWVDMTPVDYVSRAIVQLSRRPESMGQAFQLTNPEPLRLSDLAQWLKKLGRPMRVAPFDAWRDLLLAHTSDAAQALAPLLPLIAGGGRGPNTDVEAATQRVRFDCTNSLAGLAGSGVVCPPVDSQLLGTYLDHLTAKGMI